MPSLGKDRPILSATWCLSAMKHQDTSYFMNRQSSEGRSLPRDGMAILYHC